MNISIVNESSPSPHAQNTSNVPILSPSSSVPSPIPPLVPSSVPSPIPSLVPSLVPSPIPSPVPSLVPSPIPSPIPSLVPSFIPKLHKPSPSLRPVYYSGVDAGNANFVFIYVVLAALVVSSFLFFYRKYICELFRDDQEFLSLNQDELFELGKMSDKAYENGVLDAGEHKSKGKRSDVETRSRSMGQRDRL